MWYTRYMTALGDYHRFDDSFFAQIHSSIVSLSHSRDIEVSIVVIAYNEQARLLACLWSLSQMDTRHATEIVVVDNNSTDDTAQIIRQCGARYVFEPLRGVGNARQAGLQAARGAVILSADADTLYPSTYLDRMVKALLRPGVSCVFTPYWFYEDGLKSRLQLTLYSIARDFSLWIRSVKRPELAVGGAAMAFRRQDGVAVGWKLDIRRGEDGSMLLGLKRFGRARILLSSEVRVRSTSRTLDADGSMWSIIRKRMAREFRRFCEYFTRKSHYKDQDYNKLND